MKKVIISLCLTVNLLFAEDLIIPTLDIPTINVSYEEDEEFKPIKQSVDFFFNNKNNFVDQRNIFEDDNYLNNTENVKKWIEAYKKYANYPNIEYVQITSSFKMIAEVYVPQTEQQWINLENNLIYYQQKGYNGVLFCFIGKEEIEDILKTINFIKEKTNMSIWAVYTKEQGLHQSVFDISPQKYIQILTAISPHLTGYINSWKRTSVHLWKQDDAFMKLTNYTLRNANPNIYLVGEFYYGEVYGLNYDKYKIKPRIVIDYGQNMFLNASGCMIVNYGSLYTDFTYLFSQVLKKQIKQQTKFIGLIHDIENNIVIENNFLRQGCIGIIAVFGNLAEIKNL